LGHRIVIWDLSRIAWHQGIIPSCHRLHRQQQEAIKRLNAGKQTQGEIARS
jgi:hypothetical protein